MTFIKFVFLLISITTTFGDTQMGPPRFIGFQSTFNNSELIIKLNPSTDANGEISQYVISLQRSDGVGDCIFWIYDCGSCRQSANLTNVNGLQTDCKGNRIIKLTNSNMNNIVVSITDSTFVLPYTSYTLNAQGNNAAGWSRLLTHDFTTSQYKSDGVKFVSITSSFPKENSKITFSPPDNPNGQMFQYIVFINSLRKDKCIQWNITCSDCTNEVNDNRVNYVITVGCTPTIFNMTFKSSDTSITVVSNNIEYVKPYTQYNIQIQSLNGWGWSDRSETQFTTSQYKPGSPRFVNFTSVIHKSQLLLQINAPLEKQGQISQYMISLRRSDGVGNCIYRIYDCESCRPIGYPVSNSLVKLGCYNNKLVNISIEETNTFTIDVIDPSFVILNRNYKLEVVASNTGGWGDTLNATFTITPQESSHPTFEFITSSFPNENVKITFAKPTNPNGQIPQYLVLMNNTKRGLCIFWIVNCTDCTNKIIGNKGVKIDTIGCTKLLTLTSSFTSNETSITVVSNNEEHVVQSTQYDIQIQAGNTWGWSNYIRKSFKTSDYRNLSQSLTNYKIAVSVICILSVLIITIILVILLKYPRLKLTESSTINRSNDYTLNQPTPSSVAAPKPPIERPGKILSIIKTDDYEDIDTLPVFKTKDGGNINNAEPTSSSVAAPKPPIPRPGKIPSTIKTDDYEDIDTLPVFKTNDGGNINNAEFPEGVDEIYGETELEEGDEVYGEIRPKRTPVTPRRTPVTTKSDDYEEVKPRGTPVTAQPDDYEEFKYRKPPVTIKSEDDYDEIRKDENEMLNSNKPNEVKNINKTNAEDDYEDIDNFQKKETPK